MPEAAKGLEKLELLVVADPHPDHLGGARRAQERHLSAADLHAVRDATGSRTASNRSLQWGEQIVKPIFESKNDYEVMYCWPRSSASPTGCSRTSRSRTTAVSAEDILREINRGGWSTGYCGQSPERLKLHMANQEDFDLVTLRGRRTARPSGDYYGLPWPCWGTPELKHPGTPHALQHQPARHGWRRHVPRALRRGARRRSCRTARVAKVQPAGRRLLLARLGDQGRLSRVHLWACSRSSAGTGISRRAELAVIERIGGNNPDGVSWATDLSGGIQRVAMKHGCIHYGNGKARANALEPARPDPGAPRADLHAAARSGREIPDAAGRQSSSACPISASTCRRPRWTRASPRTSRIILTSGRLVEYEGGGEETRSNKWLAELQQDMFVEINPADAAERGIKDGALGLGHGRRRSERQGAA